MSERYLRIWVFLKVRWFLFKEKREVYRRFPSFIPYEKAFAKAYYFINPFQKCRNLEDEPSNIYGETPLPAFAIIAQECGFTQDDFLIELGCGRGRGCFFLNHILGCKVLGIDHVPLFIEIAKSLLLQDSFFCEGLAFQCAKMQVADLKRATAIYLYGTSLIDRDIHALIDLFQKLDSLTKIITVSYPLSDYSSSFYTFKQFSVTFPWGEADVFLNFLKEKS